MLREICAWTASTSSIKRGGLTMLAMKTNPATTTTIQPRRAFLRWGSVSWPLLAPVDGIHLGISRLLHLRRFCKVRLLRLRRLLIIFRVV